MCNIRIVWCILLLFPFAVELYAKDDPGEQRWIEDTWRKMSLEKKAGQLLWIAAREGNYDALEEIIRKINPAGIHVENMGPVVLSHLAYKIRKLQVKLPLLLSVSLNSIDSIVHMPDYQSVKHIRDQQLITDYYLEIKRQLDLIGFQMDPTAGVDLGLKIALPEHKTRKLDKQAFKKALYANDGVIISSDYIYWLHLLVEMVSSGDMNRSFFENKVKKVLQAKSDYVENHIGKEKMPDYLLRFELNQSDSRKLQFELYKAGFRIVNDNSSLIPIKNLVLKSHAVLIFTDKPANDYDIFAQYLNKYFPAMQFNKLPGQELRPDDPLYLFDRVFVKLEGSIDDRMLRLLSGLEQKTELYIAYFGNEYELVKLQDFSVVIWHPEINILSEKIGPQLFFGGIMTDSSRSSSTPFRLAYEIPETAGMDAGVLTKIDRIVADAIGDKAMPGCQILVARNGKVVFERNYGTLTYNEDIHVTSKTLYDLASLTKVIATLPAIMHLAESGIIDPDTKASFYLEDLLETNKSDIILRDILTHQAGLFPYLPFWQQTVDEQGLKPDLYTYHPEAHFNNQLVPGVYTNDALSDSLWKWMLASPLIEKQLPQAAYSYYYSDLGFYILKELAEKYLNQPIDSFLIKNIYDPMGIRRITFLPACRFSLSEIAPTEFDTLFRKTLVHGVVHDQTAAMFGGIAGHAGLFGNANNLAKIMEMYLLKGVYGGKQYFSDNIIDEYTRRQYANNRRGMCWDKPDPEEKGNSSRHASFSSFGHSGFTGTSLWADPEFGLIFVFLSNRVHPDAENFKLIESGIRIKIHDVVYESVWEYDKTHGF